MDGPRVPPMERRLQQRYVTLVKAHMHSASTTAAGPTAELSRSSAFSATQAAWRFFNNERVSLSALAEPLRQAGRQAAARSAKAFLLAAHDWSKLKYAHRSKKDTTQLSHVFDVGYEAATVLLVDGTDGSPLAPMQMHLKTAAGMLGTDETLSLDGLDHLDQIGPTMDASRRWGLHQRLVHIVDREADSVDHYRQWAKAGHLFLVRADDRIVLHEKRVTRLSEAAEHLLADPQRCLDGGEVCYRGGKAHSRIAHTAVTLHRSGRKREGGARRDVPGRPLLLRFIVSRLFGFDGRTLATWYLLSNVPAKEAEPTTLARWYYWRWRIESYFKLLKSHGQQIEQWQQESGPAIARRLLVAAMACVVVWELLRRRDAPSAQVKDLLVRLSGRQMKYGQPHSAPALLAGLFVLLPILHLIEQNQGDLTDLAKLIRQALPFLDSG